MADAKARPTALAVLDAGRTNVRLVAVSSGGRILSSRQAPNAIKTGEPYPHCDVEHIERWLMAALRDFGERFEIEAVVPTTYGSTAALVDDAGELVLPVLDYESPKPAEVASAYAELAPWFEECFCPIDPGGLTLGRQLFWQSRTFPDEFARARWILPFPQCWAWRLSGVPASEVTSLGAQTQLWNPRAQAFSALARQQGWAEKFPPLRKAWAILGPLKADVAVRSRLPADTPVLCGIHDSSANFARYLAGGLEDFTLISSGSASNCRTPSSSSRPSSSRESTRSSCGRRDRSVSRWRMGQTRS
jgi:L-fuculokinase